jgi:hypothetical protein
MPNLKRRTNSKKSKRTKAAAKGVKENLAEFLMNSPLRGSGLRIERLSGRMRPVDL